ncbi:hypothetical protein CWE13_07235 [Aliidiomarina shirensis]|uniref:Uncharacterized protein n=1 Tax=Aliidiomarina shirensis TaxID=1048642 RepID=A0A432WVE0_9GAMM|nr:hypothetical protein CWE13_07235 [Aliidiomarina shirensis]
MEWEITSLTQEIYCAFKNILHANSSAYIIFLSLTAVAFTENEYIYDDVIQLPVDVDGNYHISFSVENMNLTSAVDAAGIKYKPHYAGTGH